MAQCSRMDDDSTNRNGCIEHRTRSKHKMKNKCPDCQEDLLADYTDEKGNAHFCEPDDEKVELIWCDDCGYEQETRKETTCI